MVTEEGEGLDNGRGGNVEGELVLVDRELLDVFGQASGQVLAKVVEGRVDRGSLVGGVDANGLLEGRGRGLGCGRVLVLAQIRGKGRSPSRLVYVQGHGLGTYGRRRISREEQLGDAPERRTAEVARARPAMTGREAVRRPPRSATSEDRAAMVVTLVGVVAGWWWTSADAQLNEDGWLHPARAGGQDATPGANDGDTRRYVYTGLAGWSPPYGGWCAWGGVRGWMHPGCCPPSQE